MKKGRKVLRRFSVSAAAVFVLLCAAAMAGVQNVHAATLTVTSTADSGAGSLRQALVGVNDGDTIQFDPAVNGTAIGLTSAELVIDRNITITGPGPSLLAVSRVAGTLRIFHVLPGHAVLISGLKIADGSLSVTDAGGGVFNDQSTLTLSNCAVVNNFGGQLGGGICNNGGNARLTIVDCTINSNRAGVSGGAAGGGICNNNGTLDISNSTISGNSVTALCGGIYNTVSGTLSIRSSVVDGNAVMVQPPVVGRCGGIFNAGTAEVTNCTISHNTGGAQGGGIDNQGSLTIANSTINNNTVISRGGGISNSGPLVIINSTVSGNTASFKGFGDGGGIFSGDETLTISNSTVSGNSAGSFEGFGGGIYNVNGTLHLENTILNASGTGGNIFNNSGTVISHGYNLSSDAGGGFLNSSGDQINTNPLLGPLQNNGGPTLTHALLAGSPAINAGNPGFIPPPLYDQRGPGFDRVHDGRIDIGSFEVPGTILTVTSAADGGVGSLRAAIAAANNGDTVQFATALNGQTVSLASAELVIDKNIAVSGPGPSLLAVARNQQASAFRIFRITPGHAVTISGLTIRNGVAPTSPNRGGGIFNDHAMLTVNNCALLGNSADFGGGIHNNGETSGSASLTINGGTLAGNTANFGAGIFSSAASSGSVTLVLANSTVSANAAATSGGGIFNEGDNGGTGTVRIDNSTLSGNTAVINAGALLNDGFAGSGVTVIANSTLSGNTAGNGGTTGTVFNQSGSIEIGNTILKSGQGPNLRNSGGGTIISHGYNLAGDDGSGFLNGSGDQLNTDPLLGPLQANGGPTFTHTPLFGSPAVDTGDPTFTPSPTFDQRGPGFPRVANNRINIGSVEAQPGPTPTPTPTPTLPPCPLSSSLITVLDEKFDSVTPPALPAGWTAMNAIDPDGMLWQTSNIGLPSPPADSTPNAAWVNDPPVVSDKYLDSPGISATESNFVRLTFRHNFNLESGFDGGVLEIKAFGGQFVDILAVGGSFQTGGYNATIATGTGSPIAGRQAWSGNSSGFITTIVNLPPELVNAPLRWRMASDNSGSSEGWRVDTINVVWCHFSGTPTPPPTPTIAPTPSPTPTTPTPTPTATVTPATTPSATPTITPSPTTTPSPSPAQALNISTRLRVGTGDSVMIGGFIITGTEPKKVALRGIGPSLINSGLSDVLADPTLELRGSDGALLMQSDDWQDDPMQAAQLSALGLALQDPKESGIVATLQPGAYTAILAGKNQTAGIGLVEIYDADVTAASQLANISTRGLVQTGDNVMIGGFILGHGSGSAGVAVRGIGPSLSQSGLSNVLADPTLELRDSNGALLIANDNWQDDPDSAAQLMAYGLAPTEALESGIFASLPGGAFTAILAGKNGGMGVGLVEVYDITTPASLTVYSTADSGAGSLRHTIAVANSGDIIRFDPSLNGQTIGLTSGELVLDKNITISGPASGLITVRVSGVFPPFRIFHVMPGRTVVIEGLTIRGGGSMTGGGILNDHGTLTVNSCAAVSNLADSGGGIYNEADSTALVINSSITGNFAAVKLFGGGTGAGIYNRGALEIRNSIVADNSATINPPHPGTAGGIYNETGATLTISKSTVSGNRAGSAGGGISNYGTMSLTDSTVSDNRSTLGGNGGGIENGGPLTIVNSTISGNGSSFKGFGNGGGIYNGDASLIITNSTISGNSSGGPLGFGGGIYLGTGTLQIENTILKAGPNGANLFNNSGTITSLGYNLSSDDGGGFLTATGDQVNTDPMLGPLQDNGGPTFTHGLLSGSPAIDAGDPNFVPPPLYDQRGPGFDRVRNGRVDIGSFEVQSPLITERTGQGEMQLERPISKH